jgi:FkbM family methyltransferase
MGVRVAFPYGFELLLPCWDPDQTGTALSGSLPEKVLLSELRKIVRPGDVVIDGGAHVGFYSIAAAKFLAGKGRVIAFEADPRNFALLESNLALNHVEHIVSAEPVALADRESTLEFWRSPEVSTRSSLVYVESQRDKSIRVPCTRLDVYLAQRGITHVDVIKLDVEGAEPMCINGMQETIKSVGCFVFELNRVRLSEQGIDPLRLVEEVAERGSFSGVFVVDEDAEVLVGWDAGTSCTRILNRYGWVNILLRKGSRYASSSNEAS